MSGERDGLASPMTPLTMDALNQASAMAAAAKMAAVIGRALEGGGHGGEGASAAEMEQRSLDEEERTLQVRDRLKHSAPSLPVVSGFVECVLGLAFIHKLLPSTT